MKDKNEGLSVKSKKERRIINKTARKSAFVLGLIGGIINALFGILYIVKLIMGYPAIEGNDLYLIVCIAAIAAFILNLVGSLICRKRRIFGGIIILATAIPLFALIITALLKGLMNVVAPFPDLATVTTIITLAWLAAQLISIASGIMCLNAAKVVIFVVCIILAILSVLPFIIMIVNATRSTPEIQSHAISLLPSGSLASNWAVLAGKTFNPFSGFLNSVIVSTGTTFCAIYFSTLTAYALFAYRWRLRQPFFTLILAVMMIPSQVVSIGFYRFMYDIGMTNNFLALILPAIAAPMTVFFMRQYMLASLNLDIVASARIDGAGEFRIFNGIVLPIMKPAMATQAIFTYVTSWNSLFLPMILLTKKEFYTMPIMVSLLKGDFYKTEYGAVYLALTLSVLPLFVVYFVLSKYIIAGVALGSVKE